MKQLIFGVLIILCFHFTYGQETRPITKKSAGFREDFNVLTTDKKVKQGAYKKYEGKDDLIVEGNYENNIKIGEWKFYSKGELEQTYDFTAKEIKYSKKPEYPSNGIINGTLQEVQLDSPPLYIGSKPELTIQLNKVMTYPQEALKMGIEGKVLVSVWVTENNDISDIKVIQGIMNELDREATKGLAKVDKNWIAGKKDGSKIKSQLLIIVEFKLQDGGGKTITVL